MNSHELLAKMLEESAEHLESLEVYKDFPDVPHEAIDEAKAMIQEILRRLAKKEKSLYS